jgi:hypothetical protein
MDPYANLLMLLDRLNQAAISFDLTAVREAVMVQIAVPGQRWEIEVMADGSMEIEKFTSNGHLFDSSELDVLFRDFAD